MSICTVLLTQLKSGFLGFILQLLFQLYFIEWQTKYCGFVVNFVATGGRCWSFLTVTFEVFKPEKEEEFIGLYLYGSICICISNTSKIPLLLVAPHKNKMNK